MTATARRHAERILTLHPAGKQGVNIERAKYEALRRALLRIIPSHAQGVLFGELPGLIRQELDASLFAPHAGLHWYLTTVKLDLQARGEIEIVAGARPQRLRRRVKGRR